MLSKIEDRQKKLAKTIGIPYEELHDFISTNIDLLNPKEREAVNVFFGFGASATTLTEMSAQLGISPARGQQYKERSVAKLKDIAYSRTSQNPLDQKIREFFNHRRAKSVGAESNLVRIRNCLMNGGMTTVREVTALTPLELLIMPNMHNVCVDAVERMLATEGLSLARS